MGQGSWILDYALIRYSSAWRRLKGDLINVYKYLKCKRYIGGAGLFSVMCRKRTRGNGKKLEHNKFYSNIKKNFLL